MSTGKWNSAPGLSASIITANSVVSRDDSAGRRPYLCRMGALQPSLAEVAALVGNPARANMLQALVDGRALTASELAYAGGVAPQTASEHLAKLTEGRLLALAKQGRHSYYRLASPLIATMLESIMAVAADGPARYQPRWRGGDMLRNARTCYDHLAGRLGVAIADALVEQDHITLSEDGGVVTPSGEDFFVRFGIDLRERTRSRRPFAGHASIGASAALILRARSERPSPSAASNSAGSAVYAILAPCSSRRRVNRVSPRRSASRQPPEPCIACESCGPLPTGREGNG